MTTTTTTKAAVIVGVGPSAGLGAALGRRFAREGLHVYLAGRTAEKLERVAAEIRQAGGAATPVVTDAALEADMTRLFGAVTSDGRKLEIAAYCVGALARSPIADLGADTFRRLWAENCFGGFLLGREAARLMLPEGRGTIFFSGATASIAARAQSAAFASSKAALRAVAQSMARELGPKGIHVAHVIIDGIIHGERAANQFPEALKSRGDDGALSLEALAEAYWTLHRQDRTTWTHELDLRPYKEPF